MNIKKYLYEWKVIINYLNDYSDFVIDDWANDLYTRLFLENEIDSLTDIQVKILYYLDIEFINKTISCELFSPIRKDQFEVYIFSRIPKTRGNHSWWPKLTPNDSISNPSKVVQKFLELK